MHSWSIFGARTNHDPNLGEPPPSPLIIHFAPLHKAHIQMAFFVPGLPSGSFEIVEVGTIATLGPHNFVCKPSIEMRFKTKL